MAWSKKTALKIMGINPYVFARWYDRGFIRPSVRPGGRGKPNQWNTEDIMRVCLFKKAHECGFTLEESKRIAYEELDNLLLEHTFPRVQTYREKKRAAVRDVRRPVFHQAARPTVMMLYLRNRDREIEAHRISSEADLGDLYGRIKQSEAAAILNLSRIVEEVLEGIERVGGRGKKRNNH